MASIGALRTHREVGADVRRVRQRSFKVARLLLRVELRAAATATYQLISAALEVCARAKAQVQTDSSSVAL